jgi:hypothetical protein
MVAAVPAAAETDWREESDAQAQILLTAIARFQPELAGQVGVAGLDTRVIDLGPAISERREAAYTAAANDVKAALERQTDARVRGDLEILIRSADLEAEREAAERRYLLPVFDVAEQIFVGVSSLLDPQVAPERRDAAAVRLRRYAGLEEGYTPLAALAEARVREQSRTLGLLYPYRPALEQQLATSPLYLDGIEQLLTQYGIKDADRALKELRRQVSAYDAFLRAEVLPKSRADYRLPPELYALLLRDTGIDLPPAELAARARTAFVEIRAQLTALTPVAAAAAGVEAASYKDLIRGLRAQQLGSDETLALYQSRLSSIEEIIRREKIVTLPERDAIIRLATAAESAQVPAPQLKPPRLIGNTGERAEFLLPLALPPGSGVSDTRMTDFSFDAVSWTLTAHEARPGHELQFAGMVESGVTLARALFAFNSVNVEGWALYAEAEMLPYLPADGQLFALQFRLLRAARAFLDPGLQDGSITLAEARRVLLEEVVLSEAMTEQELQRYTWRSPGQAPSYFHGYQRLLDLRAETEIAQGADFDRQRFHDFVLAQGLLPPDALARAVRAEFSR